MTVKAMRGGGARRSSSSGSRRSSTSARPTRSTSRRAAAPRRGTTRAKTASGSISARKRASLPRGSYVYGPSSPVGGKGRKAYPIHDRPHARNALARAAQPQTSGNYRTVERAVNRKYPDIATRHHTPRARRA